MSSLSALSSFSIEDLAYIQTDQKVKDLIILKNENFPTKEEIKFDLNLPKEYTDVEYIDHILSWLKGKDYIIQKISDLHFEANLQHLKPSNAKPFEEKRVEITHDLLINDMNLEELKDFFIDKNEKISLFSCNKYSFNLFNESEIGLITNFNESHLKFKKTIK